MPLLAAVAILIAVACSGCATPAGETVLSCGPSTEARWLPDSVAGLCLPTGFRARTALSFARSRGDTLPEHWLSIQIRRNPALESYERWPITLASGAGCIADCTTTDGLVVAQDTIAGVLARVERGLVSGGISGEHRTPTFVASLDGRPGWTAVVSGYSPSVAVRDSLIVALTTLRIYPTRVRDR